jgi:hypothetical protein
VADEAGNILGSFSATDIIGFTFADILFMGISSGFGGTFHVKNLTMTSVQPVAPTYLTIAAEPSVTVGSPVNVHGTLTKNDTGLANELIVLRYRFPGADEWFPIGSVYTDTAGNYNIQWVNTATGTFTLRAEWKGNSTYPSVYANVTLNSLPAQNSVFFVESNSTVTSLAFNSTTSELSFTVSGPSGTAGYVKVTVARSLLPDGADAKIYLDGKQLNYELQETSDSWVFTFSYHHSTHTVTIDLSASSATLPEADYSIWILTAVAASSLVLLLGIFLQKRKSTEH